MIVAENMLSEEEQKKLFFELRNSNNEEEKQKIKNSLFLSSYKLVTYVVSKYFSNLQNIKLLTYDDVTSIGSEGLLKAINKFDVSKNFKFSSFAVPTIKAEILMEIRRQKKLEAEVSLNKPISVDGSGKCVLLEEVLETNNDFTDSFLERVEYQILRKIISETLTKRDEKIVLLKFGLYNKIKYTSKEISQISGIPDPTVRKIVSESVKKIRKAINNINSLLDQNNKLFM